MSWRRLVVLLACSVGWSAAGFAQSPINAFPPGMFTGRGATPAAGATLTYTATDVSKAWDNSGAGTFTSTNIGTVAADRTIIVSVSVRSNSIANCKPDLGSGVTVGGVAMTDITPTDGVNGNGCIFIYKLFAPSGVLNAATATVQVSAPFNEDVAISVGNINGSTTTSASSHGGAAWQQASAPRGQTNDFAALTVPTGGLEVFAGLIDRNTVMTANSSNTTLDVNNQNAGGANYTFFQAHGTNGTQNFNTATNFFGGFVAVAFQP